MKNEAIALPNGRELNRRHGDHKSGPICWNCGESGLNCDKEGCWLLATDSWHDRRPKISYTVSLVIGGAILTFIAAGYFFVWAVTSGH
jgi:hypothetical protein